MTRIFATDTIVVGSGPGGAAVARSLARSGRRGSLLYTAEGMQIIRPLMVGGATSMYCGCATPPPSWLKGRYGIDIDAEVAETSAELGVAPLPAELRGSGSTQIADAARALGYDWQPQAKLMSPGARPFTCSAHCMLGCRCGAKWNAGSFIDQAVATGAELVTSARVLRVIRYGRRAVGVIGRVAGEAFIAYADTVVLSAGGIGTPRILQASGIAGAGEGLTVDTTLMVYGVVPGRGTAAEPPMSWSWRDPDQRFMLSTLVDPWLMYPLAVAPQGFRQIPSWARYGSIQGIMIKLKDEIAGRVGPVSISKPATASDQERLWEAQQIARKILCEVGAKPETMVVTGLRGTHPGSTVRIGALVDQQLQTELEGLYVCDASVFPEALAQPTVLTIIGLGKRLASFLTR
jgi:choline dehydrogenase-like flavoprotein